MERATVLTGEHVRTNAYFVGATRETNHVELLQGPTVWYRWSAPTNGFLHLGVEGFTDPGVYVFTNATNGGLVYLPQSSSSIGHSYDVSTNQAYYIAVVSPGPNADGTIAPVVLELDFGTRPVNDEFANRMVIEGDDLQVTSWAGGLSQQEGEPFAALWWSWTAPATGTVQLYVSWGFGIEIYTGTNFSTLTPVPALRSQSDALFWVEEGVDYQIATTTLLHKEITLTLRHERYLKTVGLAEGQVFRQGDPIHVTFEGVDPADTITNFSVYVTGWNYVLQTNQLAPLRIAFAAGGTHRMTGRAEAANGRIYTIPDTTFHVQGPSEFFDELPLVTNAVFDFSADFRGAPAEAVQWLRWKPPISGSVQAEQLDAAMGMHLLKSSDGKTVETVEPWVVEAGQDYILQAVGYGNAGGYRIRILQTPPGNDDFANATVLDASTMWEPIRIDTATADIGEPTAAGSPALRSVWYLFTPPTDGVISFGAGDGLSFILAPQLWPSAVFKDGPIGALERIEPMDGAMRFVVEGGQRYRLRLQKAFEDNYFPYVYFSFVPKLPNDDFSAATTLEGDHVAFEFTMDGVSSDTNEPVNYAGFMASRTIWYRWQAPYDGFAAIRAPGVPVHDFGFGIEVFREDDAGALTNVAAPLIEREGRIFEAKENGIYYVRFSEYTELGTNRYSAFLDLTPLRIEAPDGLVHTAPDGPKFSISGPAAEEVVSLSILEITAEWESGLRRWTEWIEHTNDTSAPFSQVISNLSVGQHILYGVASNRNGTVSYLPRVEVTIRPHNDDFTNRITLMGRAVTAGGSTVNATIEPGEPVIGNPPADLSVWYSWTAPVAAPTTISVIGENYVRLFEGESLATLTLAIPQVAPAVQFTPERGRTYQIAVASVSTNPAHLHWSTFGLRIQMELLKLAFPTTGSVFAVGTDLPVSIITPEVPSDVLETTFEARSSTLYTEPTHTITFPGLVTNGFLQNLPSGNYIVTTRLKLTDGHEVSRSANIRMRPAHTDFTNAMVLAGSSGAFEQNFQGADHVGFGRYHLWYRYEAETNGWLVISHTNRFGAQMDLQASVGEATNALTMVPVLNRLMPSAPWVAIPITNGVTYNLRFQGTSALDFTTLQFMAMGRPENDLFENAVRLDGEHLEVHSYTTFATNEVGEPSHFGLPQRTLWWKWRSPARRGYVTTGGRVKLYSGDSLTNLTAMPPNFFSEGETDYYIVTEGSTGILEQDWALNFLPSPANDNFADRAPLQGRRVRFQADLSLATGEEAEKPAHGFTYGHTVWFTWTAPSPGQAFLRYVDQFPRVFTFRGTELTNLVPTGTEVNQRFPVQQGEQIHISVDQYGGGPGTAILEMILDEAPANDHFENAMSLVSDAPIGSWNFAATRELGEPNHEGQFGGRSVWFQWTARESGEATVAVTGDISTNLLAVYRGPAVTNLAPVASAMGVLTNELQFSARAGEMYYIAVDGLFGATGDFEISVRGEEVSTEPSRFGTASLSNGILKIAVDDLSQPAEIERSVDLVTWELVQLLPAGTLEIELPPDQPKAFYRLKRSP